MNDLERAIGRVRAVHERVTVASGVCACPHAVALDPGLATHVPPEVVAHEVPGGGELAGTTLVVARRSG